MSTTKLTPKAKLLAARAMVRTKTPYFRAALHGLVYHESPGLNTMAMTKNGVLLYDVEDLARMTVEETAASIVHELFHYLRDHHARGVALGALNPTDPDAASTKELWNIAGDCEINDDLPKMGFKLPGGCVYPSTFGLPDGRALEEYYAELRKQQRQKGGKPQYTPKPGPGRGQCGSGGGNPVPNEPQPPNQAGGASPGKPGGQDGNPSPLQGRTTQEHDRIKKAVAADIKAHEASRGRGSVPGGWSVWADGELAPPKVDWRQKLPRVLRHAVAYRPGSTTTNWQRFSRKQAAIGFGPGKPVMPSFRAPVPRVKVALDTSGSMGRGELTAGLQEIDGILKAVGAEVEFTACDSSIHEQRKIRTWRDAVALMKGGGGTDFRPVFDSIRHPRPGSQPAEVLVFITDGDGTCPPAPPPGLKVVWVLVGRYRRRPCEWGDVIEIDDEEKP